ncbi:M48 family metallopeptidase [Anaerobium acetethylicum]|uniref:YgjP-like metallopeptidase domain-containing protein n=1 Tax=Anaerobium acetethylicum TaxID=1619234 RepID=A0A1D3TR10_9FIRM|nr:SprT family zinc-dependent metalloprotease [Anaerobium acetethylicum]SCP96102.1 hypothetical protein SAMN05421730_1003187 [Anaerobium acetethylicum]
MTHSFSGETIGYNLIYKKRKTMGIYIDCYGNIEVRVPKDTSAESVEKMIEAKWNWIVKTSSEMKERTKGFREKTYEHGENFLYLGKTYPIRILPDEAAERDFVVLREEVLHVHVREHEDEKIRQALKRFYYQQCKSLVEGRIRTYQSHFKTKPKGIKISDNKANWGTCDSKYQMTFNWKLAMAPMEVIDYVVVHEMCHMVHLNHERSFWRLVGKIMPDYEERQKWLAMSSWKMVV